MGEYADELIDSGMYDYHPMKRSKKQYAIHLYRVLEILAETERGICVLLAKEDETVPFSNGKSVWLPKSEVRLFDLNNYKMVSLPSWLITKRFGKQK